MQPKMIHYICEKYAVTSNIPVTVFSEGRAEESFLAFPHAPKTEMFSAPVHTLLSQRGGAHYLLTKELLQFGSVWEEESGTCAVVGPVSCIALSDVDTLPPSCNSCTPRSTMRPSGRKKSFRRCPTMRSAPSSTAG